MEEEAQKLSEMNAEVEKQVDNVPNEYGSSFYHFKSN